MTELRSVMRSEVDSLRASQQHAPALDAAMAGRPAEVLLLLRPKLRDKLRLLQPKLAIARVAAELQQAMQGGQGEGKCGGDEHLGAE